MAVGFDIVVCRCRRRCHCSYFVKLDNVSLDDCMWWKMISIFFRIHLYKIEIRSFIIFFFILHSSFVMPPKLKIKTNDVSSSSSSSSVTNSLQEQFVSSLSPLEKRVCAIAESHLESSFDLSRSSGFIAWKAKNTWPWFLYNIADVFHHLFACFTYLSEWLFILSFVFFDGT